MDNLRIGHGFDVHQLVEGRRLVIGGVDIPHDRGLLGYSDADVLLHAVCDALLGAASLGDIGTHFPPTDPSYKDADSIELLRTVRDLLGQGGFKTIINIDAVIMAEHPKLAEYIDAMRAKIASALGIASDRIGLKSTTTEKLGFTGREEGIAASVVCLIRKDV